MNVIDFNTWIRTSAIGDTLTYYSGFLARDRTE